MTPQTYTDTWSFSKYIKDDQTHWYYYYVGDWEDTNVVYYYVNYYGS